jgi:pimeloyl-ACP methyl ester carboxylesterase
VFRTGDLITARGLVTMAEAHTALPTDGLATFGGRCVHLVTQTGTGPPVVLLGGCGVPSYDWNQLADLLPDLALIRLDRPGLMGSPWPGELPRLAAEVDTLVALLESAGPAVVVAHSMAGFHAEALARRRPDLVVGLALADGSVEFPRRRPWPRRRWRWLAELVRKAMVMPPLRALGSFGQRLLFAAQSHHRFTEPVSPQVRETFRDPDTIASVLAEQAAYPEQAWDLAQLRERFAWPQIPTIVLTAAAGGRTRWIAKQARLATLLDARQVVVADSHHLIMLDRPDVLDEAVRALLGKSNDHG